MIAQLVRRMMSNSKLIKALPKAELHIHIEGSLEPELLLELSARNRIQIKYNNLEQIKAAYNFSCLQSFLNVYYAGMSVLRTSADFYQLAEQYAQKCIQNNVVHAEIFFDPQAHIERGVPFETIINGIYSALTKAQEKGHFTFSLIMCFLRHLPEESALNLLQMALPFRDKILGIGLDSSELGHPPSKFVNAYARAREHGYRIVAHAGEEAPSFYIWQAIQLLKVQRIDHGIKSIEEPKLMAYLRDHQIALTVCPLSNLKLAIVNQLKQHPLKRLLEYGITVCVNSDDPAYFGGYINHNLLQAAKHLELSEPQIRQLIKNSFTASFMSESKKREWISRVDAI